MGHLSSILKGLASSLSIERKRKSNDGREGVKSMAKVAKKNELILRTSGTLNVEGSKNLASVYSKRGEKGSNQDRCIVWEEFGGQEDMMFCGVFDGHGPWGHFVAKKVREAMPSSLLCKWRETLVEASLEPHFGAESDKELRLLNIWKQSYLKTCAAIDQELRHHRKIDAFYSGTAALTIVRQDCILVGRSYDFEYVEKLSKDSAAPRHHNQMQGELIFIANVGDCRAVLASSVSGNLVAEQLTIDLKPNLPQEAARISECNGRVYSLDDEAGVERLWLPNEESPGLAMSRAFGDYCVKDFGLISVPQLTHIHLTPKHHFIVLATDGVWDVISNEEAVEMVSTAPDRAKAAKRLVDCAARAWKRKRKEIAMDDISSIVLFLH